jgi:hypothetical protein
MVSKKGAIELSIGTIVIIVLAMAMLILGLVLVRSIFSGSTTAVNSINTGVLNEIQKVFADTDKKMAIYPSVGMIELKQKSAGSGFAFSVRNTNLDTTDFIWKVYVDPQFDIQKKCHIGATEAESWLTTDKGSFTLGRSSAMESPELVTFTIPDNAPAQCPIIYRIDVSTKAGEFYDYRKMQVTITGK